MLPNEGGEKVTSEVLEGKTEADIHKLKAKDTTRPMGERIKEAGAYVGEKIAEPFRKKEEGTVETTTVKSEKEGTTAQGLPLGSTRQGAQ